CAHGNRPERRFCTESGARLGRAGAACGTPADPGEKFCGNCGAPLGLAAPSPAEQAPATYTPQHLAEKILTSRETLEGERKQVTVLFADVKGSMELAEQLDPEDWHRMEQLAEPGKPLLTERTAKLVTGFFSVRDLGPSRVKGMTEPIRLYELEGAGRLRTRFDVSRARGLSRFVGRAPEMAALEASLEHALAGEGQIVGVVGEPGVGKSRLCHEFAERCRARGIPF